MTLYSTYILIPFDLLALNKDAAAALIFLAKEEVLLSCYV